MEFNKFEKDNSINTNRQEVEPEIVKPSNMISNYIKGTSKL